MEGSWAQVLTIIDAHVGGEIGRVVVSGLPPIAGHSLAEKFEALKRDSADLIALLLTHPRGHDEMSANLILPAHSAQAAFGLIVLQPDGPHAFSGSNAICAVTALIERGLLPATRGENRLVIDTAIGPVSATAQFDGTMVKSVSLTFAPSFSVASDLLLNLPGGQISVDVAFGGAFYVLVDPAQLGLVLDRRSAASLLAAGGLVLEEARRTVSVRHPILYELDWIEYVMFCTPWSSDGPPSLCATILPPGRIDRSPCGTGTCARLASLVAKGTFGPGDVLLHQSLTGAVFEAHCGGNTVLPDGRDAIVPQLTGRAYIHAHGTLGFRRGDPPFKQT